MKDGSYDPYLTYTIDKYFAEVDAGMIPPDVDTLRWYIDEKSNKFKLDRFTKYTTDSSSVITSDAGEVITANVSAEIDYPGDMWANAKDPLSGWKNDNLSASEYVKINKVDSDLTHYIPVIKLY